MIQWDSIVARIDAGLPAEVSAKDEDVRRRGRLVIMFAWALVALAPVFAGSDLKNGRYANALVILSAVPFGLFSSAVFRRVKSLTFMGNYNTAIFGYVLIVRTLMTGGITAYAPFWLSSLPVLSLLLAGRRSAMLWTGLNALFSIGMLAATKAGVQWMDVWTLEERQKEFVIATAMLSVLMLTLALLFEAAKEKMRHELRRREDDIRRMLDIMGQGFVTLRVDGTIMGPHSSILETWFGTPNTGRSFAEYLQSHDPKGASWVQLAFDSLAEDVLPLELVLEQFPRRLTTVSRRFSLEMKPVMHQHSLKALVAVVTDISAELDREKAAVEQREVLQVLDKAMNDRRGFLQFFTEAERLLEAIRTGRGLRDIHTLKGNAALFGAATVASVCHEVESETIEAGEAQARPETVAKMQAAWEAFARRVRMLVTSKSDMVEVSVQEIDSVRQGLRTGVAPQVLGAQIERWLTEPIRHPMERLGGQARALAVRLGKVDPHVIIDDQGISVRPEPWAPIWGVMAHVVRNAVDHGLEPASEREAKGKSPQGTLRFSARQANGLIELTVADDGRGIDWEKVATKAQEQGLPTATRADLEAALLRDGFSTATEVTDVSGRGVGLGAVAALCRALGGSLRIESKEGSRFTLVFPDQQTSQVRAA